MRRQVRHPAIPQRLRRVRRAHEVESEEVSRSGWIGDEYGAPDNEGDADAQGGLPTRTDAVRHGGVDEGSDYAGCVAGGGVVVLLDEGVAARGEPECHDVVLEHLDREGVDYTWLSDYGCVWKGEKRFTHEDGWKEPELPAEKHPAKDGEVPGVIPAVAKSRCSVLFLLLGEEPSAPMRW